MAERAVEGKEPGDPSLAIQTSLHTLVQGQVESISAFHTWLNNHVPEAPDCQEVASAIREHLASHKALVLGAEQRLAWPTASPSCWGPIRCRHASPDGPAFSITGPAPGDRFEVSAAGHAEAAASLEKFVSYISKMVSDTPASWPRMNEWPWLTPSDKSENLAAGEAQIRRLIDIISELEELQLGSVSYSEFKPVASASARARLAPSLLHTPPPPLEHSSVRGPISFYPFTLQSASPC